MPGIITDAIAFAEASTGCNYVSLLAVLLMGCTTASPNRKPTGLSHQLAAGKMPGHLVDGRLAITTTAWAQYGPEYLGHYLGKALVKLGICSAKQARGMKFATLAKQVFDPTAVVDYVNDMLLVAIEHMHTAGSNGQASMGRVDYSMRYKDILLCSTCACLPSSRLSTNAWASSTRARARCTTSSTTLTPSCCGTAASLRCRTPACPNPSNS